MTRYNAGHVVSNFTPADFENVASNWQKITSTDRKKIREGAEEYFSLANGIEAYKGIYGKIVGGLVESSR